MDGINGKVVALTGASSGIGRAVALDLAAQGAALVLAARRRERLEALVAEITAAGGRAIAIETDVRDRAAVGALVEAAIATYGRLDVMIANAGVGPISRLDKLREDDWEAMVDVNFKGVLHCVGAALPVFRSQGDGHFIATVSTAGLKVLPTMAVYAATKNAVRTLMEGLRQEAGPDLRVTEVSPGYVGTEFGDGITDPEVLSAVPEAMKSMALPPESVARAIRFAIAQPREVDIGSIVVRPTAQG
ncbi:SDR family oxidoreductase [Acidimangrovimonas sediminis]|uniref:SDR family oxidoreductase n=1 Tax=Acidimangrovimonas sediminis TaxID=2056283 RepID=UPI000C80BD13|nr:SDR family oxidoreductase [Acidimangrovimonas sediminis]